LRIVIWNVNGRLAIKITQPHFVRLINDNDVIIFQETFLRIGEERTLTLPPGFEIIAMSRPDIPGLRSAWGGVAAVIRTTIPFKLMSHLCAPDLIVLDLHHLFLVGSYLLPAASGWRDWTTVDPQIKLAEAVTALSIHVEKPLMVGGDINARVGERIPTGAVLARSSSDPVVNTRGRWLLRLCSDTAMTILNGTTKESSNRGAFTSFQPLGSSVIDYCFVSARLIPRIGEGSLRVVKSPVWSDHAQVQIAVIKPEARLELSTPTRVPRPSPI
jgi:exonuclease III